MLPLTMPHLALPPVRSARELKVGDCLGKLLLTDAMGEGATGKIYRALHQTLRIPVAVKILQSAELESNPGLRAQLRAEAQLLAQLSHPNIIRVWDFEDDPELPYIVLEIVEGLSLAELIAQSGRLSPRQALDVITQVADGLAAAQRLGIIHRDVKPGNILLTRARVPKIVDLGLAVVCHPGPLQQAITDSGRVVDIVGTPAYMAPEQFLAPERVDHRSDIYSLGITFFHALTGQLPFDGATPRQVMLSKVQQEVPPPHEIVLGINSAISEVVLRMTQRQPDDRHEDYEDLLRDLRSLRNGVLGETPEPRPARSVVAIEAPAEEPLSPIAPAPEPPPADGDTSLTNATQKVEAPPVLPARLLEAAEAAARAGDRDRACELLRHVVRVEPTSEAAWLALTAVAESDDEKIAAFRRLLDLNPAHSSGREGLAAVVLQAGIAAARRGEAPKARALLAEATNLAPGQEIAWLWRARVADGPDEAETCLRHALEINPTNDKAKEALGRLAGRAPGAGWTCPVCLARAPSAPRNCPSCGALLVLADLAVWRGRPPLGPDVSHKAEGRYRNRLTRRPDAPAHIALALINLNAHRFAEALPHLRAAVALRPTDAALARQVEELARQLAAEAADVAVVSQGTVLVVDESPTIRKVVARTLTEYDYRVLEAGDGATALALVREQTPDLVLLDPALPGMDGYEVCRALRADASTADLPILLLTTRDGLFDRLRARRAGATATLAKPFRPEVLVQVVEEQCRLRRRSRPAP